MALSISFDIQQVIIAILSFLLLKFLSAMLYSISSVYINELIPSTQRATIILISSMFFSLMMILIFLICGIMGGIFKLGHSFLMIGGISSGLITSVIIWHQVKKK